MEKKKTCFKVPAFSVPSKTKDQTCSSKCQESLKDMKKTTEKEKSVKSHEISTVGIEKETKNKSLKEGKKLNKKRDTNKASEDTNIVHPAGEGSEASGVTQHQGNLEIACSDTTCMGDNLVVGNQQEEEFTTDHIDTVDKTDKNEADEVSYIQLQPVKLPEVSEAPSETGKVKPALGKREHEDSARGREKKPDKKRILPVRSLTDDEYESIFSAAVENVLNMNIDEWNPKSSNISSVSKSYKKTVGKPVTTSTMKKTKFVNGSASKDMEKYNEKKENSSELKKKKKSGHSQKNRENAHPLKLKVLAKNTVDRHQEESKSHIEVQKNSKRIEAQIENETTPAGSGDEQVPKNVPEAPARKKLKKSSKSLKQAKLEPRELPFTSEEKAKSSKKKYKTSCIYKTGEKSKNPTENISESSDPNSERKTTDRQKEMLSREISLKGTWVQCCKADCLKWRYLPAVTDPSNVPEYWTCSMNTRTEYNSCDKEEEYYDESKHIYTKYCEGSIVWAKVAGYPWWPAMIEIDPDLDVYFETAKNNNMIPTYYHVVFLDDKVSRIWVKTGQLMPFDESHNLNDSVKRKKKGSSYEKEINAAKRNAIKALSYPLQERIKIFGFASRYKGHWGPTEDSTAKVTQNKSRNSKKQKTRGKEETIDDSTMDDVLGNTEALLSNVEEMLDSLDSDLDDSADDSDFSIDELICVERKKRKSRHEKDILTDKEELTLNDEEEETTLPKMSVAISKDVESTDEILQIDVVDISEETEKKSSNLAVEASKGTKLNLDPEIFTMELDDDRNTDSIGNVTESGMKDLKTDNLTDKQDQCMVGKETRELKHNKKKLEKSMNKKCSEKPEYDNRNVTNDPKTISTAKKEVQTKSKSADKTKPTVGKIKKSFTDDTKELSPENATKQRSMDCDNEYGKENVSESVASPGNDSENLELIKNSGETTDTGKLPSETESFNKDDCTVTGQDRLVQYNLEKPNEEKDGSGTEGISLDDESDTEFDLVEHSMYDGTTGADKVLERERALLSRKTTLAQLDAEDSDPFDIMEE